MDGQPVYGAGSYTSLLLASCSDSAESDNYIGYVGIGIVQSQMQALQMTILFFLPSMLFSSFMFPFRGMKGGSQTLGETFPLTHFLRVVRSVILKGGGFAEVQNPINAMLIFTGVAVAIVMLPHRRTLD